MFVCKIVRFVRGWSWRWRSWVVLTLDWRLDNKRLPYAMQPVPGTALSLFRCAVAPVTREDCWPSNKGASYGAMTEGWRRLDGPCASNTKKKHSLLQACLSCFFHQPATALAHHHPLDKKTLLSKMEVVTPSKYITLVSADGFEFVVLREAALVSPIIKGMLDVRST